MQKKLIVVSVLTVLLALPLVSSAVAFGAQPVIPNINLVYVIQQVLYVVWWVFIALTVILFVLAGISFLTAQGDPTKLEQAKQFVVWGSAGVVIGVLAFSAITIIRNTLVI